MSVEYAVDAGRPAVVLASDALADALYDADVPETEQPLDAHLVDSETLAAAAADTTAECVVLTPTDPVDPLEAAETLPAVYYAPRDDLSGERVRDLAAHPDVDYVPANGDVGDHALLRSRVTERVAAERVRDDRDIRAEAMDQAGVGITVADADDPDESLVYVNRGFESVTGYAAREALGRNCRFLQGADTDPESVACLREAIAADVSETVELRNYRADGTSFWNRVTVAPVYDDGAVTHYVGIQDDVTEQVATQRAQHRMVELTSNPNMGFEAKVEALLELGCERFGVDVGFLSAIDEEFEVVAADSAHPGLQPGATEPLSTTYCRRTIAADDPLAVEDAAEEWADDPAYERWELACYVGANVEVDGELYGTLCFADTEHPREFTDAEKTFVELLATWVRYELERRERERRLERENERLSEFASVVSHDLRNPLGVAKGHLEVLAAGDADDATVDEIATSLDRMAALIEDVLTLARDGEVVDDPEVVSVSAVATEAWRVVDAPDAELDVDRDAPHVRADPERLRTVLENLFRNAVEHGSPCSQAEPGNAIDDGDATRISVGVDAENDLLSVEDDGTGIPERERDDVFEHGFTTNEEGTGFGLAIVREIADAHGWIVSLDESETGGARFEFHGVDVVEE
ncbi:ATP-binding protein [Halorubellus sp. PRR65]|uniref:ATP-binding protein n=1 Tax=Halorubellus sp. PRR65 TaxID=3098148 RepID=UPI002B260D82|nr:ATP-binding protein [Halorubellus sp. PRR65]